MWQYSLTKNTQRELKLLNNFNSNIKPWFHISCFVSQERLDFSCAMFGPDGGLVANAPHIPVHLGAMQETVQYQVCTELPYVISNNCIHLFENIQMFRRFRVGGLALNNLHQSFVLTFSQTCSIYDLDTQHCSITICVKVLFFSYNLFISWQIYFILTHNVALFETFTLICHTVTFKWLGLPCTKKHSFVLKNWEKNIKIRL